MALGRSSHVEGGRKWLALAAVLVMAGILVLGWGVALIQPPSHFDSAIGTVLEVRNISSDDNRRTRIDTTIQADIEQGNFTFDSSYGDNSTQPGDEVEVWYDPNDPGVTLETKADKSNTGLWVIFSGLGILIMTYMPAVRWWTGYWPRPS